MSPDQIKEYKGKIRNNIKALIAERDQREMIYLMKYSKSHNENNFMNLIELDSEIKELEYQLKERFILSYKTASGLIINGIAADYEHLKRKAAEKLMNQFGLTIQNAFFLLKTKKEFMNIPLKFDPSFRMSLLKTKIKNHNILYV